MDGLNLSAFNKRSSNIPIRELLATGLCLFVGMLLFVYALEIIQVTFSVDPGLIAKLNTWVGGPIVFGVLVWMIVRALRFSQNKKNALFRTFARDNGFIFEEHPSQIDVTRLLDFGSHFSIGSALRTQGTYKQRNFQLHLIITQSTNYSRSFPHFYGLLHVTLNTSHPSSLHRYPSVPPGITLPAGVGKISTEIIGDHLYFLREEGFDMTPEGMARLFNLIERVDKIDPPRQLI